MAEVPQGDVIRRAALPTADLGRRAPQHTADEPSDKYLDRIEEDWNKIVDTEIQSLADGMVDIVTLATIGDKDKIKISQEAFQAQLKAESMVKAANSLLSVVHSMKLLLLLSDESQIVCRRDAELESTEKEKEAAKKKVAELLDELLRRPTTRPAP